MYYLVFRIQDLGFRNLELGFRLEDVVFSI